MKRFIYLISALLLLASCVEQPSEVVRQFPLNVSICFETKAGGSSDETVQPVINSVRVLGFDADDAGKPCVLNDFFPFGYTVMKAGPAYKVQMSSPIIINSQSTHYDFYVVLNEGDYSLVGQADGETVSDLLVGITPESSHESDFTGIYATLAKNDKTDISGNPVGEPAFLMCAKSMNFEISETDQKLPDAKELEFTVPGGRTMAQIVIEKITSAPMTGYATNETAVPLVFVKSISLENVPSTIDWDEPVSTATGADPMSSITVGAAVSDSNGVYYLRVWPGYLTTTLNVNASVTQTTDARFYLDAGFAELKQDGITPKEYKVNDYGKGDKGKDAKAAYNSVSAKNLETVFNGTVDKGPNKDKDLFTAEAENIKSYYSVTSVTSDISSPISGTRLAYTDDVWTVNLGEKYYVPENIATDAGAATYIKVVLAIAEPSLDLSGISDNDLWPAPGSITVTSRDPEYTYYLPCSADTDPDEELPLNLKGADKLTDANARLLAKDNWHVVYKSDRDTDLPWYDTAFVPTEVMNVYVDGFYRRATGTSTITVNQNQKGGDFKWNIPTTSTLEYHIPVSQNGGDYSVVRNTRYKITLHVNKTPQSSAPSSSARRTAVRAVGADFGITAIVETEKINDYED